MNAQPPIPTIVNGTPARAGAVSFRRRSDHIKTKYEKIIICFLALTALHSSKAQNVVNWNFSAKKISDKVNEVHLTPVVQRPWHIYSQTSPEGGALPTTISFNKNPLISMEGKTNEVGKVVSK